jgi:hypothetical protein
MNQRRHRASNPGGSWVSYWGIDKKLQSLILQSYEMIQAESVSQLLQIWHKTLEENGIFASIEKPDPSKCEFSWVVNPANGKFLLVPKDTADKMLVLDCPLIANPS